MLTALDKYGYALLMNETRYTISQAAGLLGVSVSTLRRWEASGIVTPERTAGNDRRYTEQMIEDLRNPSAA